MKRTEVEELLSKMDEFADFLISKGKISASNELMGAIETIDAVLENVELEEDVL